MTSTISVIPTDTSVPPSASSTSTNSGSSGSSSPLLFFVALGFGVLFTNLWIIVGVKYCFRYSQRNRRAAQGQPFEEELDLTTLHPFVGLHHPVQRRRREKKLLKIDEVNERFPVMTYKAWKARRERQGLSAEGGIAAERVASANNDTNINGTELREVERATGDRASHESTGPEGITPSPEPQDISSEKAPISTTIIEDPSFTPRTELTLPTSSSSKLHRDSTVSVDPDPDEEDQDHIPNELLPTSGDNCAICIELLEDDDEVRGLTCGHCYHQACLDPWLTQRRASCPLCKADYYIPKPPATTDPNDPTATITPATTNATGNPPLAVVPENAVQGQQNVITEHWAPVFFRPFRGPAVVPTPQAPPYPPPFGRYDRLSPTAAASTARSTQGSRSATSSPNNAPTAAANGAAGGRTSVAGRLRRIHVPNPFRRHNVDVPDTLERGEVTRSGNGNPSSSS